MRHILRLIAAGAALLTTNVVCTAPAAMPSYSHSPLLRTIEAAFGISEFLGHAGDSDKGVATMTPLSETAK